MITVECRRVDQTGARHDGHEFIYVPEGAVVMQAREGKEVTPPGQRFDPVIDPIGGGAPVRGTVNQVERNNTMGFYEVLDQAVALLRRRGRVLPSGWQSALDDCFGEYE